MIPRPRPIRAATAAAMVAVLTALSVAVPLLDQGLGGRVLALTEAGTSTGYLEHHHGVCLQHSAAAWSPAKAADLPSDVLVREAETPQDAVHRSGRSTPSSHHSRAPPRV